MTHRHSGPETGLLLKSLFLALIPRVDPLPNRDYIPLSPDSHPTQVTIQEEEHLLTGTL